MSVSTPLRRLRLRAPLARVLGIYVAGALLDWLAVPVHNRVEALALRAAVILVLLILGLAVPGPKSPPWGQRLVVVISVLFIARLTVLAGGTETAFFDFMLTTPFLTAVFLPRDVTATRIAAALTVLCGAAVLVQEGVTFHHGTRWVTLAVFSAALAVYASHVNDRLRDADRRAEEERSRHLRQMAASVAHEFNNQLGVLQNTISLLRRSGPSEPLAIQQEVLHHLQELTSNFSAFSNLVPEKREITCLGELACSVASAFPSEVQVQLENELTQLSCERSGIARALLNILKNGLEAGAPVRITVGGDEKSRWIRVADSGPGFTPDALLRGAEPFFTTKARGSGLGLAVVQELMARHQGQMLLRNDETGGAIVELRFDAIHTAAPLAA